MKISDLRLKIVPRLIEVLYFLGAVAFPNHRLQSNLRCHLAAAGSMPDKRSANLQSEI